MLSQGRMAALGAACVLGALSNAHGAFMERTIDFSTDDNGDTIVNGQKIDDEFFADFTLATAGNNQGSAAFDSTPGGPNDPSQDTDLLVGLGNILIFQNNSNPAITNGVFDSPNDATNTGTWTFDFFAGSSPGVVELLDIALVDIDGGASMRLVLTDIGQNTRTYVVPNNWTFDVDNSPLGWDTLDLTTLADQLGEGGGTATASEDAGFNPQDVVMLEVTLSGSGAIDNVHFQGDVIPTPGTLVLCGMAGLAAFRRRR